MCGMGSLACVHGTYERLTKSSKVSQRDVPSAPYRACCGRHGTAAMNRSPHADLCRSLMQIYIQLTVAGKSYRSVATVKIDLRGLFAVTQNGHLCLSPPTAQHHTIQKICSAATTGALINHPPHATIGQMSKDRRGLYSAHHESLADPGCGGGTNTLH